jgi:surface antigen
MQRLFLASLFAATLVAMLAIPQAAKARGLCYWWWTTNGVKHYSYYGCAHPPTRPPWQRVLKKPAPGSFANPTTPPDQPPTSPPGSGSGSFPNLYPWGQCTWWAAQNKPSENLEGLGNAGTWASNASGRGLPVGPAPRVGATAVFAPGVQGAGGLGHVAHVVAVSGERFEVSEMNYTGGSPPGGFGKVDYRWAAVSGGVTFIY